MDRYELQKGFTALKPLYDSLMKDPSIKCSLEVIDCIKTISNGDIQDLLDYILFPVIVHLQNEDVSIVSGLQEVVLGSDIQGHKITMMAIRARARIIRFVMQDKLDEETMPLVCSIKEEETNVIDQLENKLHCKEAVGV
ncbi:hypothetical protein M0804_013405 [Polistes exclamans]|nr:hypothetical protein M0804_013405 [Polistes exclamans]